MSCCVWTSCQRAGHIKYEQVETLDEQDRAYFVNTADPETERTTLNTCPVHIISDEKDELGKIQFRKQLGYDRNSRLEVP